MPKLWHINGVQYLNREILHGDVLDKLATISDETIDVIISSPPFWSLRDYSVEGQIGLEPDFHDYLNTMQKVMDGLKRVLKPTGTCWINLGDTYNSSGSSSNHPRYWDGREKNIDGGIKQVSKSVETKSLLGIPQRFMINCIDNGWICRNDIVWSKVNAMPSSVKDRFSNKHERIFFFSKNKRYYFDLDAVRVPSKTASKPFNVRVRDSDTNRFLQGATDSEKQNHNGKGEYNGKASKEYLQKWIKNEDSIHGTNANNPKGKNPGDIFQINPKPFPEAHFATFPLELPLKILKCACPNQVCNKCGKARESITDHTVEYFRENNRVDKNIVYDKHSHVERPPSNWKPKEKDKIIGYTDCGCNAGFKPGIVLDPFFGAGTVGLAAEKLGLNWIGIELNAEYIKIAQNRLSKYMNNRIEAFV